MGVSPQQDLNFGTTKFLWSQRLHLKGHDQQPQAKTFQFTTEFRLGSVCRPFTDRLRFNCDGTS
jgi:hypothetical protein